MSDNYAEETQPLFKLLRTEAFRFVIVRYNHYSFVEQLEKDLKRLFPKRPIKKVDAQKLDYTRISNAYFALKRGFFFIKNFDDVLKEERDSLNVETHQYAAQNERRRHITAGLNLRRDKLAKFPIALFVFVPASTGELYAKIIMEKMPDLWSFRSYILDLEKDISTQRNEVQGNTINIVDKVSLGNNIIRNFNPIEQTELNRLVSLLEKTPKKEIAYRLTLYPQIADAAIETGNYKRALSVLNEWEKNANESDNGLIWVNKGDLFITIGNIEMALSHYEKAHLFFEKNDDEINIAVCLARLGNTYTALGNLDKALSFYKEYNHLAKELYTTNPTNLTYKNSMAISYSKLGNTYTTLGNLDKALSFYEEYNQLAKELFAAKPTDVSFKKGLAISYATLGETHIALGNLDKALTFYEDYNRLEKELYATYSTNVSFKYGLSISNSKLGEIYSALGNLDKALDLNEKANLMIKELNLTFSNNVEFKNNLAESFCDLGKFSRDKLLDKAKAMAYFKQAESLWIELVRDAPKFVEFQKSLVQVQKDLADL